MSLRLATGADGAGPDMGAQIINGVRMPTEIRLLEVAALLPYARNSKTHGPKQIAALCERIKSLGWTNPVLVAEGTILAGHGRVMAAQKLGLARVPTIDCSHLNTTQRRELIIWDNRSGELDSGWDLEMLKLETDDLRAEGVDLEAALGFSEEDLAGLFEGMDVPPDAGGADPDDAPELPAEPVVRVGDTWICGPHRVHCGDSTDPLAWDRLMLGELADIAVTDPPYGVDLDRKNRLMDAAVGGKRAEPGAIANDKLGGGEFAAFIGRAYAALYGVLKPGATVYVAHSDKEAGAFRAEFERAGFTFSQTIIWRKNQLVLGMARYQPIHEPILVGRKPGSKSRWFGGRKQTTVMELGEGSPFQRQPDGRWAIRVGDQVLTVAGDAQIEEQPSTFLSVAKPAKSGLHQSQKPTELIERLLRNSARPQDIVIDGFGGSGTTLVAAERMGMCARIMELDPAFCEVIVRRYMNLTGRRPALEGTGELLPEPGAARSESPPPGHDIF
jgi:DNA modification methylase